MMFGMKNKHLISLYGFKIPGLKNELSSSGGFSSNNIWHIPGVVITKYL